MSVQSTKRSRSGPSTHSHPKKRSKRSRRQFQYHSSSEDEGTGANADFQAVNLRDSDDSDTGAPLPRKLKGILKEQFVAAEDKDEHDSLEEVPQGKEGEDEQLAVTEMVAASDSTDLSDEDDEGIGSDTSDEDTNSTHQTARIKKKRNDPDAFATSISKILTSKLSTAKRSDPVLSRSKDAADANKELNESRLEAKARHKIREEKRQALDRGRLRDVLGLENPDTSTAEIMEREKKLRKTAQRGVVKLFNAVRAAQVKGEQAQQHVQRTGTIGIKKRDETVTQMSKQGFLDFIASGGT